VCGSEKALPIDIAKTTGAHYMTFADAGTTTMTTKVVGKKDEWTAIFELLKEYKKEFQHVCPAVTSEYRGKKL
jgi:hypothetical protein